MKLIPENVAQRFAEVGSQDALGAEALVIAVFFNPCGRGTWLATEYDPEKKMCYGYASLYGDPTMDEWGYFSIEELEAYTGPMHLGIERDLFATEKPASKIISTLTRN